jgi:hypothetical protein
VGFVAHLSTDHFVRFYSIFHIKPQLSKMWVEFTKYVNKLLS